MTSAKQVRAQYTQEFKLEAVRQVKAGQAIAVVAKVLGIPKASLSNWVRLAAQGKLDGVDLTGKAVKVTAEQMELARLRAEVTRLRMERDIAKKSRRTSRRTRCGVRLDTPNERAVPGERVMRSAGGQCQQPFQLAAPA
jgi:transposase-like protein